MVIQWRLRPDAHLHYRSWGGATVVFDEESGHTHLLGEPACSILKTLSAAPGPLSAPGIHECLADKDSTDVDRVFDITAYLARLELVERVR